MQSKRLKFSLKLKATDKAAVNDELVCVAFFSGLQWSLHIWKEGITYFSATTTV